MGLVIVGSVAFDTIETPRGKVERAIGGSAVYSSMVAGRFCEPMLVGVVGEDFTVEHGEILVSRGVDIEGLETVTGGRTFFWEGRYGDDPNERETIVTELNVFESFSPKLPESYLSSGYLFLGNIDPVLQLSVLEQFPVRPVAGIDTMNFWIEGKPEDLRRVLEKVDIVFINDSEARMLSGREDLDEAASRVMGMGPGIVIIKKGAHGADLFTKDMKYVTPAFPLDDVLDPTGAGDTFAGGFMGYIASAHSLDGETLENAMAYAGVSASFTCEKFSVERLRDLELEEITGRYEVLRGIIRDNAEYGRFPFKGPSGTDA